MIKQFILLMLILIVPSLANDHRVRNLYKIAANSKTTQVEKTILEASQNTPAQVAFEPGEYIWGDDIKLKNVNDLTIDGSGATILYNKNKTEAENAPNKK